MIDWVFGHLWEVAILGVVGGLQLFYFLRCLKLVRANVEDELAELREELSADIISRAMRGEDPDWLHYSDRADRFGEHRFESIRVYANTALATGIGGTIFTLSLHFFLGSLEESEAAVASHAALEDLLHHMGWALIASAIGVVNNLLILLVLLPFGNKRFNRALAELNDKLHATRDDNKPAETLAEAVRDKLGEAFKDAVERFPDAFARLDVSVEALGEIIEVQTKEILRAESGLREGADTLASASEAIAPAAQELSASISRLLTLPSAISDSLTKTQEALTSEIRADQRKHLDTMAEILHEQREQGKILADSARDVANTGSDVVGAVRQLPPAFAQEITKSADMLGNRFGDEARNLITDVINDGKERDQKLRQHLHEQIAEYRVEFLNRTSDVILATVKKIYADLQRPIVAQLVTISEGLREAAVELPKQAKGFAQSLATIDGKLQAVVQRIDDSTNNLNRAAKASEEFQAALIKAHDDANAPLRAQMSNFVHDLSRRNEEIDEMVSSQVQLIERLLARVDRL